MAAELWNISLETGIFQRVGASTKKARVPILVLTLGTKSKVKLGDRSWTRFHIPVSNECKYDGSLQENDS